MTKKYIFGPPARKSGGAQKTKKKRSFFGIKKREKFRIRHPLFFFSKIFDLRLLVAPRSIALARLPKSSARTRPLSAQESNYYNSRMTSKFERTGPPSLTRTGPPPHWENFSKRAPNDLYLPNLDVKDFAYRTPALPYAYRTPLPYAYRTPTCVRVAMSGGGAVFKQVPTPETPPPL